MRRCNKNERINAVIQQNKTSEIPEAHLMVHVSLDC